jgi:hypothetical protein
METIEIPVWDTQPMLGCASRTKEAGEMDYESPAILRRDPIGDPLVLGYISPTWTDSSPDDAD